MSKLFWQVFKYGLIGVLATVVNFVVAEACAVFAWPCLGLDDPLVRHGLLSVADSALVTDAVRATRAVYCNVAGFFVANVVCYVLNRKFVFTPGRHHWTLEYLLFLAGSGFAIACGSLAIWILVRSYGMTTTYSFVINVFVSVAVNFVVRKYFVFKG